MKSIKLYFLILFVSGSILSQKPTIYLLPGQGSDSRIFDSIHFDTNFRLVPLIYDTIPKFYSIEEIATLFSSRIDTISPIILIGVSLGGMICVEMAEQLNPLKTIIISSAKNRKDLPFRYTFQKKLPIYAMFSPKIIKGGAKFLQPIVEPDRKKNKHTFKSMLEEKKPSYYKISIKMIMDWKRINNSKSIIHIHGDRDHTLPIRKIDKIDYTISKGSHMMTLVDSKKVEKILHEILK